MATAIYKLHFESSSSPSSVKPIDKTPTATGFEYYNQAGSITYKSHKLSIYITQAINLVGVRCRRVRQVNYWTRTQLHSSLSLLFRTGLQSKRDVAADGRIQYEETGCLFVCRS